MAMAEQSTWEEILSVPGYENGEKPAALRNTALAR